MLLPRTILVSPVNLTTDQYTRLKTELKAWGKSRNKPILIEGLEVKTVYVEVSLIEWLSTKLFGSPPTPTIEVR